jgi:hypothetical protein
VQYSPTGRANRVASRNALRSSPGSRRSARASPRSGSPALIRVRAKDPAIADLLKPLGYVTGQFGKNHLGDKNEFLPTAHGFDGFFSRFALDVPLRVIRAASTTKVP